MPPTWVRSTNRGRAKEFGDEVMLYDGGGLLGVVGIMVLLVLLVFGALIIGEAGDTCFGGAMRSGVGALLRRQQQHIIYPTEY
jgi:hypothetical protein